MPTLRMWDQTEKFSYDGSVEEGVTIGGTSISMPATQFAQLLSDFAGRGVPLGLSEDPPSNSVAHWLRERIMDDEKVAHFIGAILVDEGYCERLGHTHIIFL